MSLETRIYSVLVVSSSEKFNSALLPMLPESEYGPVRFASDINAARRMFAEYQFNFVIINSPLSDDTGIRFAVDTCTSGSSVTLYLVRADFLDEAQAFASRFGVFTLAKPTSRPMIVTALGWLASARERLRSSEKTNLSLEKKMEEIRLVNKAKWLLISRLNMEEKEAHRHIERQAMDRCITKRDVAEEIIQKYRQ